MIKAAFIGFGEVNTPIKVLNKKCETAYRALCEFKDIEITAIYPILDDSKDEYVKNALAKLSGKDFDVLVLCVAGWIPSHTVMKITEKYRHLPMALWGLCGWIEDGRIVTTADQAGTSALRKAFFDLDYNFKYFYDIIGKPSAVGKVYDFCKAANCFSQLRSAKIGQMGFRDMNLYNTLYDGASLKRVVGTEIECFEMLEVVQRAEKLKNGDMQRIIDEKMLAKWDFLKKPNIDALEKAAKYYLAISSICKEQGYSAVSLKDVDGMKKLLNFPPAPIFMLLADEDNICTIPENDCLGSVTQVIVKLLTGQVGAYLEFYEYFEDGVLTGVPDYIPSEITDGKTIIMPAAFGELSQGLLNVSKVKEGELTLCRLTFTDGQYYMHIVKGQGVNPGKWEECGWTQPAPQLPGLKITLENTADFVNNIMGQHYIISYGDNTQVIKDYCAISGIKIIE